ncbi:putative Ig domain-containing protein [Termitidicoccus mucosus]
MKKFLIAILLAAALPPSPASAAAPDEMEFDCIPAPGRAYAKAFFLPGETAETELRIRLLTDQQGIAGIVLDASVFDLWDNPAGTITVTSAGAGQNGYDYILKPSVNALGWFRVELTLKIGGQSVRLKRRAKTTSSENYDFITFAMLPAPRTPEQTPDSPFGLMTALLAQPFCPISAQVDLAAYSGARWARETVSWSRVNPGPGNYNWAANRQNITALAERGFHILGLIQTSPEWTHPADAGLHVLPADLSAARDFARALALDFGPLVRAWETWNEEDIGAFSIDPPDRYAAVAKSLSLGLSSAATAPRVLLGPVARDPNAGDFAALLAANDLAPYLDAYSFHTYTPATSALFGATLETHLAAARQLGLGDRPVWLSETSLPYARNKVPAPTEAVPAMRAQLAQMGASYMECIARNIKPVFWFIVRPYISTSTAKPSQWGMVDTQLSPLPAYPAYAAMTRHLGAATYIGKVPLAAGAAWLFNDGRDEVAAVLPPAGAGEISLPSVAPEAEAFDVMGNPLALAPDGAGKKVAARGFIVYIKNPGWQNLAEPPEPPTGAAPRAPAPVVMQALFPRKNMEPTTAPLENWDAVLANFSPRGYNYKAGEEIPFSLEIYNFGDTAAIGAVTAALPAGFSISPAGVVSSVQVAPGARAAFDLTLKTPVADLSGMVVFQGAFGNMPAVATASRWTLDKTPVAEVFDITETGFILDWKPVPGASGYMIEMATDAGFANHIPGYDKLDVGDTLGRTVANLAPGTTYFVRVYNRSASDAPSAPVSVTTLPLRPPVVTSADAIVFTAGVPCAFALRVEGTPPFIYEADSLPAWLTLDENGILSGTPPPTATGDSHTIQMTVRNAVGNTPPRQLTLAVEAPPGIPLPALDVRTLAGSAGIPGNINNTGTAARFNAPVGIAVSGSLVFAVDSAGNDIRKITRDGVVSSLAVDTVFDSPTGIAADGKGNLYIADTLNHVIRKITPAGKASIIAGDPAQSGATDNPSRFDTPTGLALDADGQNLYVADTENHLIRKIELDGGNVTTIAGRAGRPGFIDGPLSAARFNAPSAITAGSGGCIFVADTGNNTIRRINTATGEVSTLAGLAGCIGASDGAGAAARFNEPSALTLEASGSNLYVLDTGNSIIRKIALATANVTTLAGLAATPGDADGEGSVARFKYPSGIAADAGGKLYMADTGNHTLRSGEPPGKPVIEIQPSDQMLNPGDTLLLSTAAAGHPPPLYQWYFNGNEIPGAIGDTYMRSNLQASDDGLYAVKAYNTLGETMSIGARVTIANHNDSSKGGGGGSPGFCFYLPLLLLLLVRSLLHRGLR